jgi:hypothetical protein
VCCVVQLSPGGALSLPAELPGLDFSPDYLSILIGELYLNKIRSDSAADSSPSNSAMAASSRKVAGEAAAASCGSSSGAEGVGSTSQQGADGVGLLGVPTWWDIRLRRDLEGSVYDFFLHRCVPAVERQCSSSSWKQHSSSSSNNNNMLLFIPQQ